MSTAAIAPRTLEQWLAWQQTLHATEMELGLDRVRAVAQRLGCLSPVGRHVVIAGTNGKGSCAALLASLLGEQGRVGVYTSPHLWRYNERIRVDGVEAGDAELCAAFQSIDDARGDISLTYFEFATLAALLIFQRARVDYSVLEVGLGGRLDAVNIVDADVALITNIGLDHVDWLGPDRESIAQEKAGIMRTDRPVVCADRDMPVGIRTAADQIGASLMTIGTDFDLVSGDGQWHYRGLRDGLEVPIFEGVLRVNLAAALAVHESLLGRAPAGDAVARACDAQRHLIGRREWLDDAPAILYDVGHNAEAIAVLVDELLAKPCVGRTHVVLGVLADKPVEAIVARLAELSPTLLFAGLDGLSARGLSASALAARSALAGACFADPRSAFEHALASAAAIDRIVVCGSFLTVAEARGH